MRRSSCRRDGGRGGARRRRRRIRIDERERAVAQWTFDHDAGGGARHHDPAGRRAPSTCRSSAGEQVLGVLGLPLAEAADFRDPARRRLLDALPAQTAAALERLALAERSRETDGRGRGRAPPHGAPELALARHAHAARLDRGRGQHHARRPTRPRPAGARPGRARSSRSRTAWGGWWPTCWT